MPFKPGFPVARDLAVCVVEPVQPSKLCDCQPRIFKLLFLARWKSCSNRRLNGGDVKWANSRGKRGEAERQLKVLSQCLFRRGDDGARVAGLKKGNWQADYQVYGIIINTTSKYGVLNTSARPPAVDLWHNFT